MGIEVDARSGDSDLVHLLPIHLQLLSDASAPEEGLVIEEHIGDATAQGGRLLKFPRVDQQDEGLVLWEGVPEDKP